MLNSQLHNLKIGVTMKKAFILVFLAIILVSASTCVSIIPAQSANYTLFGGVINTNTTWTLANSPYFLTSPVLVNTTATLTIEPGVTVCLNNTYIRVAGTLSARGTSTNKISLIRNDTSDDLSNDVILNSAIQFSSMSTGWSEESKTGCIIENAIVSSAKRGGSVTIFVNGSSPKINNSTIINTGQTSACISIRGGSTIISNNTVLGYTRTGIEFSTSYGVAGDSAYISDNIVTGCQTGIGIYDGAPIVERNVVIRNTGTTLSGGGGIRIDDRGTQPLIRNNTIVKNTVGFNILSSPSPTIVFNNIQDNNEYNIYLYEGSASDINATYNWWGTNSTSAINQTIRDFKNDFNLGTVNFVPFLNATNAQTPAVPGFTIMASAGIGGSITPNGNITVNYGETLIFNVTANPGYQIASVLMDGTPATAPYTFTNVVSNGHTISVTFQQVVPEEYPTWLILTLLATVTLATALTTRKQWKNVNQQHS